MPKTSRNSIRTLPPPAWKSSESNQAQAAQINSDPEHDTLVPALGVGLRSGSRSRRSLAGDSVEMVTKQKFEADNLEVLWAILRYIHQPTAQAWKRRSGQGACQTWRQSLGSPLTWRMFSVCYSPAARFSATSVSWMSRVSGSAMSLRTSARPSMSGKASPGLPPPARATVPATSAGSDGAF
jgi:hypothetical protein